MTYERPRRSAGLVMAGVLAGTAGYLLRLLGAGMNEPGAVTIGWILILAGAVGVGAGLWRVLNAFDDIAQHRWRSAAGASAEEARQRAERRRRDAGAEGQGCGPG